MLVLLGLQGEQAWTVRTSPRPIRPTIITHQTKKGHQASKVHKLVVDLEGVGVGPTIVLHSVHGMGARKVLKLVIDFMGIGVRLTLVLPSVHGMGPSKLRNLVVDLEEVGVGPVVAYGSGSALLLL